MVMLSSEPDRVKVLIILFDEEHGMFACDRFALFRQSKPCPGLCFMLTFVKIYQMVKQFQKNIPAYVIWKSQGKYLVTHRMHPDNSIVTAGIIYFRKRTQH